MSLAPISVRLETTNGNGRNRRQPRYANMCRALNTESSEVPEVRAGPRPSPPWFVFAVVGIVACFTAALGYSHPARAGGLNDFLQLYAGAALVNSDDLYSIPAQKQFWMERVGHYLEGVYYSRPPFYAALLRPLTHLPYHTAYAIFQTLSFAAHVSFAWIFLRDHSSILLLAIGFLPLYANFLAGQDVAIVLLLLSVSMLLARRNADFAAGLVLSLCSIKFHLFVLVPLAILICGKRRLFAGALCGVGASITLSCITAGWDWPWRYLNLITRPELSPDPDRMPTLHGFLSSVGAPSWAVLPLSAGVVAGYPSSQSHS